MPCPRSGSQSFFFDNSLYIFGGHFKRNEGYFGDLFKFDIAHKQWQQKIINELHKAYIINERKKVLTKNEPNIRADHTFVVFKDHAYLFGGHDSKRLYDDLHELSLRKELEIN